MCVLRKKCLHNSKQIIIFVTNRNRHASLQCVPGRFFVFYTCMEYNKQPLSHEQLIDLLEERGLLFRNIDEATKEFHFLSYFRLAGYLRPMETDGGTHRFKPNSFFEDAIDLYYFDKHLRALLFTAIQSIEVAIRTRIITQASAAHGAFWSMNSALANDNRMFQDNLSHINKEISRSHEDFITSHFERYDSPELPPVWKTLEVVSFGTLSKLYSNLKDVRLKKTIASDFKLPQHIYMESWIKSVAVLRNHIAHHSRIWNRRFSLSPQLPKHLPMPWIDTERVRRFKLYSQLCCLAYFQEVIHPNSDFKSQLVSLLKQYSAVSLHAMGFPQGWENEPLWQS